MIWRVRAELRRRPWGGQGLVPGWFSAATADLEAGAGPFGEAWLLGPDSRVQEGPDAGRTLAELSTALGPELLGSPSMARYGARFPLLLKLLDAARPLSLQVHPDDAAAQRAGAPMGKSEAWWVLAATPGARLWWGVREAIEPARLRRALEAGTAMALMREEVVAAGALVVNPAGTIHALGAGVLAFEVQQASDITYRLYDHGALGADGRPRELHLDQGLAVASLRPGGALADAPRRLGVGREELVRSDSFVLESWGEGGSTAFDAPVHGERATDEAGPTTVSNLSDDPESVVLLLSDALAEPLALRRGESVLIAAAAAEVVLRGVGRVAVTRYPTAAAERGSAEGVRG